ncbi:MAG: IreB family regulatory phosphoprotein [Firmicutes bacterium]|nr:IreB family regulatory phosphoprotein [Bacillota bacterium]
MGEDLNNTMKFSGVSKEPVNEAQNILMLVTDALKAKGYNPVNQIVGYILSGDPTYITGYMGARAVVRRLERDELLEELVKFYLDNHR